MVIQSQSTLISYSMTRAVILALLDYSHGQQRAWTHDSSVVHVAIISESHAGISFKLELFIMALGHTPNAVWIEQKKNISRFFSLIWDPESQISFGAWNSENLSFRFLRGEGGGASDISHSPLYRIGKPTTAIVSKVSYRGAKRGEVWESGCKDSVYIKVLSLLCDNRKGNTADENNGGNRGR